MAAAVSLNLKRRSITDTSFPVAIIRCSVSRSPRSRSASMNIIFWLTKGETTSASMERRNGPSHGSSLGLAGTSGSDHPPALNDSNSSV